MKAFTPISLALLLLFAPSQSFAQQSPLDIYGFFTFEAEASDEPGTRSTFDLHHFNVLSVFRLDDHFRIFGEVEYEHGVSLEGGGQGSGALALERGWLEYKHSDAFRVKIGKFLPPFGLYNLTHDATPTYLFTILPSMYLKHRNTVGGTQRLYAKFATGVQILGSAFADEWEGQYYVYVSNGRGPDPGFADNNSNKGVGTRLVLIPPGKIVSLGVSYYADRNGNTDDTEQISLAFDGAVDYSNARLQGEWFLPRLERVDATGAANGSFRDSRGYYLQGSYIFFDWVTPFARYDFFDPDLDTDADGETDVVLGINLSFTPRVYLKQEVHFRSFQDAAVASHRLYAGSVSVAF